MLQLIISHQFRVAKDNAEEIVQQYPIIALADIYSVLACYLRHSAEIDAYLNRSQQESQSVQKQNELRFDPHGIRDRLIARRREA